MINKSEVADVMMCLRCDSKCKCFNNLAKKKCIPSASLNSDLHGEAFMTAFDEAYGILYIDLKIIAGACGWDNCGSNPQETRNEAVSIIQETKGAGTFLTTNRTPTTLSNRSEQSCADYNYLLQSSSAESVQKRPGGASEVQNLAAAKSKLGTPDTFQSHCDPAGTILEHPLVSLSKHRSYHPADDNYPERHHANRGSFPEHGITPVQRRRPVQPPYEAGFVHLTASPPISARD